MLKTLAVASLTAMVAANDNGLGLTPPRGWRSWNLYGAHVSQSLIESIMDGMVKKQTFGGSPTSLCDLGYCDVGLDDNWQACHSPDAAPGMNYHDKNGNPIINLQTFPDMAAMVKHAHSNNLTAGWYGNNCICSDHCKGDACAPQIAGDVDYLINKFDFDAWKLDGCGGEYDLVAINAQIKKAGKAIMVENCHWGRTIPDRTLPPEQGCPWNFYRSSGDVRASYSSIRNNLATTIPLAAKNLSYPGCWAYPDMLQVGCAHGPGGASDPGLTLPETKTHFYAWCIVSSPLTLSHDVNNATISSTVWPIISNTEALAVSEAYFGNSGTAFGQSERTVRLTDAYTEKCEREEAMGLRVCADHEKAFAAPASQNFYKPLDWEGNKTAVLMLNGDTSTATLSFNFADVPGLKCTTCHVRDIDAHKDLGTFTTKFSAPVDGHGAGFYLVTGV